MSSLQTEAMAVLPFDQPEARIAFDLVVGAFFLSEVSVRLRSDRNRLGSLLDRSSLMVVQATVLGGVGRPSCWRGGRPARRSGRGVGRCSSWGSS